jgi:hypothetical protein
MIYETSPFTDEDIHTLNRLRLSLPHYEPGQYNIGNMLIEIKFRIVRSLQRSEIELKIFRFDIRDNILMEKPD